MPNLTPSFWPRLFLAAAAMAGLLCVLAGTVGAHVLPKETAADLRETWRNAVLFHAVHALALLGLAAWMGERGGWRLRHAGVCFIGGLLLFCGTLYHKVLTLACGWDLPVLTAAAPWGGVAWMAGWALLGWDALRRP